MNSCRVFLLLLALVAPVVVAAQPEPARPLVDAGYMLQFVLALAVVIGAIFGLMYLLRRLNRLPGRSAAAMRVVGAMPLGAREKLVLVQVGDTQLLLGMAPGQLRTLHVFDSPVVTPGGSVNPAGGGESPTGFAGILKSLRPQDKS